MGTHMVIVFDVAADRLAQLSRCLKLVDINQLRLQASEPAFDYNVVCPTGFSIHALPDMQVFQKLFVLFTRKLAALIGVEDRRNAKLFHRPADCLQNGLQTQGIGQIPTHDFSAIPVDDCREIHVAGVQLDVGDVDGPDLVREVYHFIPQ